MTIDTGEFSDLRHRLRDATAHAHENLDAAMSRLDLGLAADYTCFLRIQYQARRPIEAWCARHCPASLRPPEQTLLIADDLRGLGCGMPVGGSAFEPPAAAAAIGVAWALGGSSLGNRAMLAGLHKQNATDVPVRFLSDRAMVDFWRELLPRLKVVPTPAEAQGAIAAAEAVFDHFQRIADALLVREAA